MVKVTEEEYMNYIKNLKDNLTTSNLARIYNMSTIKFNKVLQYYKIQYKRKEKWILNHKLRNKGLQEVKYSSYIKANGDVLTFKTLPKWTKKGICYIYFLLKEHSIEPINIKDKYEEIDEKINQLSFL